MSNGASARRQASRGSTHRVTRDCGSTPNGNFQRPLYRSPPTYRLTWSDLIRASRSTARSCAASGATRPVGARFSAIWLMECLRSTGTIDHMPESTRAAIRPLLIDRDVMPDLEDTNPPVFEQPVEWVCGVHRVDRNVAVHCVTRAALALMMTAWDGAGARRGDCIEHGAVVPPDLPIGSPRWGSRSSRNRASPTAAAISTSPTSITRMFPTCGRAAASSHAASGWRRAPTHRSAQPTHGPPSPPPAPASPSRDRTSAPRR